MSELIYPKIYPEEYLSLASELALRLDEAAKRSAADRTYYAVFLTCRDVLTAKNYLTPYYNYKDHKLVTDTLKLPKILGNLASDEIRLHDARNCINYDTRDLRANQEDVHRLSWMMKTARTIIKRVQALPVNPDIHR